jgi:hypothetical protein
MPRLEDLERDFGGRCARAWDNFANFALRDNVLEVAVGLMYGIFFAIYIYIYVYMYTSKNS